MDIQEYIESGILEQYALGELPEAEQAEVERLAAQHPAIRQELDSVIETLSGYAAQYAQTPPADMRDRVLAGWKAAIDADTAASAPVAAASEPEPVVRSITSAPVAEAAPRFNWLMAASIAFLLLSVGINFLLYSKWQNAETSLAAVESDRSLLAASHMAVEKRLGEQTNELSVLRSDEFRTVALNGTPAAPKASAKVLYNPSTRTVYVDVRSLPEPPAGKQYQLWALDNGKPVDAGVLDYATASGESLQHMKDIARAQAFAMTVEDAGGSPTPTLSTMTVVGNI
ncbi:anti-sigma factor [Hymenobacter aerilatus]|uniref:Regulator of SigK n=1 Tax=Hymenobacter aerilatus TaxID=2932251 RepID=A0A8T9T0Z9_9BACT|nr:anti-sigma factor [Hymenobacter aerilatus]UOR07311.1 anti-sigma factor [Hymenobacter aerilatus]